MKISPGPGILPHVQGGLAISEEPILPLVVEYYPGLQPPEDVASVVAEIRARRITVERRRKAKVRAIVLTMIPIALAVACWFVVPKAVNRAQESLKGASR